MSTKHDEVFTVSPPVRPTREAGDGNTDPKLLGGDRSQGEALGRAARSNGVGTAPREAGTAAAGRGEERGWKQAWHPAVSPSISTYARRRD